MVATPKTMRKNNCLDIVRNSKVKNEETNDYIEAFESALYKTVVYKNFDYTKEYRVIIYEGNVKNNEYPYKMMDSYPYETFVFENGNYISFNYGGKLKHWLLTSVDNQNLYEVKGKLFECTNILKWYDKLGKLHSFPCIFYPQSKANSFDFNQSINIVNALCKIEVQYNEYTNEIKASDRFILNGLAYEVSSVAKHKMNDCFDANSVSTIMFDLSVSVTQADDDLINNIANVNKYKYSLSINEEDFSCQPNTSGTLTSTITLNDNIVDLPVAWKSSDESIVKIYDNGYYETLASGNATITCHIQGNEECLDAISIIVDAVIPDVVSIKFSPSVTKILQGKTQSYEVAKYVNESKTTVVLTVEDISTIGSGYYEFAITGNNTFTVKNIKLNSNGKVKIKASDSYGNSEILEITLGGVW